jgi:hypothetical protein
VLPAIAMPNAKRQIGRSIKISAVKIFEKSNKKYKK